MPVTDVSKDTDALTLTITAGFDAPAERIWLLWSDPRQLERWWGPPTFPATFVEHEFAPGGTISYYMTGPDGEEHHGWWRIEEIDPPHRLRFEDGFANAEGKPSDSMPTTTSTVTLTEDAGSTTMVIESRFASREAMDQMVAMGMEEGMSQAVGQIDDMLAAATS